ncbi:MAG TPA: hypothetical protein VKU41_00710 [Polyangiaceae bacterium]|nr:hypothetical protein [Polyangiaceae bacterium]
MRRLLRAAALAIALGGCATFSRSSAKQAPRTSLAAPHAVAGELNGRALLAELPARASRLGASPPALVVSAEALDNEWIGGFVDVPREDCLLGYARGAASIQDIDVAIYSEEGTSLAVDEGRDVHPTVLMCPPHPARVYVAAHVVDGEGLVAVGAQLVPRERGTIVARTLGARGGAALGPRPADAWPGLEDTIRVHRREIGGVWEETRRVALSVDAHVPTYASLPIEADRCVDALIIPDDDVALLEVEATDGDGRTVARAKDGPGPRSLTICSPIAMTGTLSVRPHVGRGLAAVVLARISADAAKDLSTRPDVAWVATTAPLARATGDRNALLAKGGYDGPVAFAAGSLALGRRTSVPLDFKPLGVPCARVDVVAGAPLALVEARVWDDAGALLSSGEASSSLALFACVRDRVRLDLEARGRPGPYAVTVRPERWKDPAFAVHPLAASRMLARATVGPDMLLAGKDGAARDLTLDSQHEVTWSESVAAGRCIRVTVGAEGSGAGIEARVFDSADNEIDRSEAAHAASVRACAPPDAPRAVRFEVRGSAGQMDAVIGERIEVSAPR